MAKEKAETKPGDEKVGDPAFPQLTMEQLKGVLREIVAEALQRDPAPPVRGEWPKGTQVYKRRGGDWGYNGRTIDRGQVIELCGLRNDDKLCEIGYFAKVPSNAHLMTCGVCGSQFVGDMELNAHGALRHRPQPEERLVFEARRQGETEQEYELRELQWRSEHNAHEEARLAREEADENFRAPLDLTKTTASILDRR